MQDGRFKPKHINNNLNIDSLVLQLKGREFQIGSKSQTQQETYFRYKDTNRLK